ncbi:MAG: hypothetical protein U0989_00160 [Azonexus sp.]|nr:hypothetical protein [Azonexus sp.]MDZ4313182.1 hypothetical protein [Azonexus sp.]
MKLHQFAIGARFEYEGKIFTKTGPITASADHGGQQMIPRYANLKPFELPEPTMAPGVAVRKLDPLRVRKSFDAFYETCLKHVPPTAHDELNAARQAFFSGLK